MRWCLRVHDHGVGKSSLITRIGPDYIETRDGERVTTEIRSHWKFSKRLYHAFAPFWWCVHAWDGLVELLRLPKQLDYGFSTLTAYPAAGSGGATCDGVVSRSPGTPETLSVIRAGAGTVSDTGPGNVFGELGSPASWPSATQGYRLGGSASGWTDSANALSDSDSGASASRSLTSPTALIVTGFGFSIPAGATVHEIRCQVRARQNVGVPYPDVFLTARTTLDGSAAYNLIRSAGTSGSFQTLTYTWNDSELASRPVTPSQANASTFGVLIQIDDQSGMSPSEAMLIDWVKLEVVYRYEGFSHLRRYLASFDCSPATGDRLSARLCLCYDGNMQPAGVASVFESSTPLHVVPASPASAGSLTPGDFGAFGSTSAATIPYTDYRSVGTNVYYEAELSEAFVETIPVGVVSLGLRIGWDLDDAFGGVFANSRSLPFTGFHADETGTAKDPYLEVVWYDPRPELTPPLDGAVRLEVALTKDGATQHSEIRVANVGLHGVEVEVGSIDDLWGLDLNRWEVDDQGFGVLIRRADAQAGETEGLDRFVDVAYMVVAHAGAGGTMAERTTALQKILIGKETTPGTAVACPARVKSATIAFASDPTFEEHRSPGDLLPIKHMLISESASGTMDGKPCYNELGWWLSSIIGPPKSSETVASGIYRHTFEFDVRGPAGPVSRTFEIGDGVRAHRVKYAILRELALNLTRQESRVDGSWIAHRIEDGISMTAGANEVQTVTMGTATHFKLRFRGAETAELTVSGLTAAAIQSALQGLSTVGSGNLLVSGTTTTGPFTITAAGTLAGKALPLVEALDVVGGSAPTIAKTTRGGHTELGFAPILPGQWSIYYASSYAGLGAGKLVRGFMSNLRIGDRFNPVWVIDEEANWAVHADADAVVKATLKVEADSNGMALLADARAGSRKFFRMKATGPEISGGNTYGLQIDMSSEVSSISSYDDDQGLYGATFELGSGFNDDWGQAVRFVLTNTVASY